MPVLVVYEVASRMFALPAERVLRVLRMAAVTPLPGSPPHVRGLLDVHGDLLPVVDVRVLLGEPPRPPRVDEQLLVVESGGRRVALQIDRVREVREGAAQAAAGGPHGWGAASVEGALPLEDGVVLVQDLDRWLEGARAVAAAAPA